MVYDVQVDELERSIFISIVQLQELIAARVKYGNQQRLDAMVQLNKLLGSVGLEYRTFLLGFSLDENLGNTDRIFHLIQQEYGVQCESCQNILFPVLIPRKPSMDDLSASHGSSIRERIFSVGTIETIRFDSWGQDPETKDDWGIVLEPRHIGLFGDDRNKIFLYPRQITSVTLSEELPAYLVKEEASFVNNFYIEIAKNIDGA